MKMNGNSSFTLDEAVKIKNIIKAQDSIETLFGKAA
jgi:hypothetical protein